MCLISVFKEINLCGDGQLTEEEESGEGFKVMVKTADGYYAPLYPRMQPKNIGEEYSSEEEDGGINYLLSHKGYRYRAGYHIFTDQGDAKRYALGGNERSEVVVKVAYRGATAIGGDACSRGVVVVAGYMTIKEEI